MKADSTTWIDINGPGIPRLLVGLSLLFIALAMPSQALAVDELNLFEIDENFSDDSVSSDSCGWDVDSSGTIEAGEDCPTGWSDNVPASSTFDLRNGLVDIDEDGDIDTDDDGIVTVGGVNFDVIDGFIDYDSDNKIDAVEAGADDTCYYLGVAPSDHDAGGCFDGLDILFGYVDFNNDGAAPSEDLGEDGESLLNNDSTAYRFFMAADDTSTRITTDTSICNTGVADSNNSDCTIYTGGNSKDPDVITNYEDRTVLLGRVDFDEDGDTDTNDDKSPFHVYALKDGYVDVDEDGTVPEESDDGEYLGLPVIDGRIVIGASCATTDDSGSLATGANCNGTIDYWVGGWEWTENQLQPKNDINTAFAGTWLYETTSPGTIHLDKDFILYYGMDIAPSSGSAAAGFWLLQDETVGLIPAQGQTNNTRQWIGSHTDGDLLVQINPSISEANVFVWNPDEIYAGLPANDSSTPNISSIFSGTDCQAGTGEQAVCAIANARQKPVPTDPAEWPNTHEINASLGEEYQEIHLAGNLVEGGVNVSAVYRELGIDVPCFATAVVSTRSTESTTGTLTDFMQAAFESCAISIVKEGDSVVTVGDLTYFTITVTNDGVLPLFLGDISDNLVDAQSGAGTTLDAALAAGCSQLEARESCSFQLSYQTSGSDADPLLNTVSTTFVSSDGKDSFDASDSHTTDLVHEGSIGDRVWLDEDGNGLQDAGEDGIAGVTVALYADQTIIIDGVTYTAGDLIATTVTDVNGEYVFTGLPAADYTVTLDPAGDPALNGVDATFDADGGLDHTADVSLNIGETNTTTDFGYNHVPPASTDSPSSGDTGAIGDRVWNDSDADGVQDEGESGIAGVGVVLAYDSDGDGVVDAVYDATVTDASGSYVFDDLPPGVYEVILIGDVSDPSSLPDLNDPIPTASGPGGYSSVYDPDEAAPCSVCDHSTTTPIVLGPGDVFVNADFGYQDSSLPEVSGTIYLDADVDATESTGDVSLAGVTVSLAQEWTIVDGYLDFDGDGNGNDADDDGIVDGVQVIDGRLDLNGDGNVDGNDDGWFNGIAVVDGYLDIDGDGVGSGDTDDGGTVNAIVASTTTDSNGDYTFTDVAPGAYSVIVTDTAAVLADNYQTEDPDEAGLCTTCDSAGSIKVAAGNVGGIDFGFAPHGHQEDEGLISGAVGLDSIDNDAIDEGEQLSGIEVTLFQLYDIISGGVDWNNDGTVDSDDSGPIMVDEDGDGTFTVYCIFEGGLDANCDQSIIGNDVIDGLLDANNDGVIDGDDDGFYEGYEVINGYLDLDGDGAITDLDDGAVTAEDGSTIMVIDGWIDFDGDGTDNIGIDPAPGDTGDVGELRGDDLDATATSGTFLDGFTVEDGQILDGGSAANDTLSVRIDDAVTDAEGFYAFGGLDPQGQYLVQLNPDTYPAGTSNDFDWDGGTADGQALVDLYDAGGVTNAQTGVDFGLEGTNSLSGTVWEDSNADGSNGFDNGSNSDGSPNELGDGIEGVTVELSLVYVVIDGLIDSDGDGTAGGAGDVGTIDGIDLIDGKLDINGDGVISSADDGSIQGYVVIDGRVFDTDGGLMLLDAEQLSGPVVATTTTESDGNYEFTNLPDGNYEVKVTDEANLLNGYWLSDGTNDGDDNNSQVDPYTVSLNGGQSDSTADFGYYVEPAQVGNIAFEDIDGDGIQDAGETGIAGLIVTMEVTYPSGDTVLVSTVSSDGTTDVDGDGSIDPVGSYSFGNLLLDEDYNGSGIAVIDGLVDVNGDGAVDANDDGYYNGVEVINGYLDTSGDGSISDADDGAVQGLTIIDGWVDVNGNGTDTGGVDTPADAGDDANLVDPSTQPTYELKIAQPDTNSYQVYDGLIDINGDNVVDANDDGFVNGIAVIDGQFDVDGDGVAGEAGDDDGSLRGFTIESGVLDMDGDGTAGETDGTDDALLPAYLSTDWRPAATDDISGEAGPGFGQDTEADDPDGTAAYPTQGSTDSTNDFGFVLAGSISGTAWFDDDLDGIQDAGESGRSGTPVYLLDQDGNPVLDEDGNPISTVTSDGSTDVDGDGVIDPAGSYYFGDLYPCTGTCSYTIQFGESFNIVDGLLDLDGDGSTGGDAGDSGIVNGVDIIEGQLDINNDGVIDANDDGSFGGYAVIDGVLDVNGNGTAGETNGNDAGVIYAQPADYNVTSPDQGSDDTVDSDAGNDAEASGYGAVTGITLTPGEEVTDVDVGYRPLGTIQGSVYVDNGTTANAIDGSDSGIAEVVVNLYRDANNDGVLDAGEVSAGPVQTVLTNPDGSYEFENVLIGNYLVVESQPAGFINVTEENVEDTGDETNGSPTDDAIPVNLDSAGDVDSDNNFLESLNSTVAVADDNNTIMNYPVSGDVLFNDWDPQNKDDDGTNDQTISVQSYEIDTNGDGVIDGSDTVPTLGSSLTVSGIDESGATVEVAGELTLNADGTYTFVPADGFVGEINANYTICDSGSPESCDTTTLRISVNPWPDPVDSASNSTEANDDENISYGDPVSDSLFVNDQDAEGDGFLVDSLLYPTGVNGSGELIYTSGSLGTVTTIYGTDESGNVVVAGTLEISATGEYTFTPCTDTDTPVSSCDGEFKGTVVANYTNEDDHSSPATDTATLTIQVLAEADEVISGLANPPEFNDAPVAGDDLTIASYEASGTNVTVTGDWLANDNDPNGDPLTLNHALESPITTSAGGTITFHADGTYTYSPPSDYIGADQLTYEICDDGTPQQCDVATIYLVVTPRLDFGDLPDTGKTLPPTANASAFKTRGAGAARHFIVPGLRIGASVDGEANGQDLNDGLATGDDNADGDDEDAVSLFPGIRPDGTPYNATESLRVAIPVLNDTDADVIATAWLDFSCNFDFEPSERASGRATIDDAGTHKDANGNVLADQSSPSGANVPATDPSEAFTGLDVGTPNIRDPRGETVAANAGSQLVVFEWNPGGPFITETEANAKCADDGAGSNHWMHVRLRVTSDRGSATSGSHRASSSFFSYASPASDGPTRDGEVEDYTLDLDIGTTPAVVTNFRAATDIERNNWLRWTTASEVAVSAYRVERFVDSNSDGKGQWSKVHNGGWLPFAQSLQGAEYQLLDNSLAEGETASYRVVERTMHGKPVIHGPYVVESTFSDQAAFSSESYGFEFLLDVQGIMDRQETIQVNEQKGKGNGKGGKGGGGSSDTFKLGVAETGVQFVSIAELAEAFGVSESQTDNWLSQGKFELKRNGDDVAWFDTGDGLLFYGEAPDNTWSTEAMYWLTANQSGQTMAEAQLASGSTASSVFLSTVHTEQDNSPVLEINHDQTDDYWYWTSIATVSGYDAVTLPAQSPGALAEQAMLTVALQGYTEVQHEVEVSVGGEVIGTMLFTGQERSSESFGVPADKMGGDTLDVTLRTTGAFGYSSLFIEHMNLTYIRSHAAVSGELAFGQDASDGVQITGLSSSEGLVALDISSPLSPVWLNGGEFNGGGFEASFDAGDYFAANSSAWKSVSLTPVTDRVRLRKNTTYLVIAPEELMEGAQALVDYRSSELSTQLVSLESVYDHTSYGEPDPRSIHNYLLGSSNRPQYVVMVGDGAYDYKDQFGTGYNILSPMLVDGGGFGLVIGDTLVGDMDGDDKIEIPVGRIPAKNNAEVLTYVDKLSLNEANGHLPTLLVADNPDHAGDFTNSTNWIASQTDGNYSSLLIEEVGAAVARTELLAQIDDGLNLINYLGHGGIWTITDEGLLTNADVPNLTNLAAPKLVGLTCNINNFMIPGFDSLGERLLVKTGNGMVVSWAAAGQSQNADATNLGLAFQKIQGEHERLGDAMLQAFIGATGLEQVYILLGDPATRLH